MSKEHLKFSTGILQRLGEELNPNPDQGIVELVRNAYDADALTCKVELIRVHKQGGTVRITDDGTGMGRDAIQNGWLMVGRSGKSSYVRTSLGRIPVGQKGLGRLAALRMGTLANLITRPMEEPSHEYQISIDWDRSIRRAVRAGSSGRNGG
jgi:hypothetical protein